MLIYEHRYFEMGKLIIAPMMQIDYFPKTAKFLLNSIHHPREVFPDYINSVDKVFEESRRFVARCLPSYNPLPASILKYATVKNPNDKKTIVSLTFDDLVAIHLSL